MPSVESLDEQLMRRLFEQAAAGTYASTYLLTGLELQKKRSLAIAFAKALNCQQKRFQASCSCSSCRKIESGSHPDVTWYGVDKEANTIKIAEVREFRRALALKPYEGKVNVFIFYRAERLSTEAQNALLKSLEEPPPGNVIILLVPHGQSLFDTITSRALEIRVPPFQSHEIQKILSGEGAQDTEAAFLARSCGGELSQAREAAAENWFQTKNEWLDALMERPDSFLDEFHRLSRAEVLKLLSLMMEWVRDLLVFQASGEKQRIIHVDRIETIELMARRYEFDAIMELFESIGRVWKSVESFGNQKLALTETQLLWERFIGQ